MSEMSPNPRINRPDDQTSSYIALENSTLSPRDTVSDSRPTVGKLTPARFQTMSFPDGENRKISSRIDSTTSGDALINNASSIRGCTPLEYKGTFYTYGWQIMKRGLRTRCF